MKFVVPSRGSMTQRSFASSFPDLPNSSPSKALSGKDNLIVSIIIFSAI